ncbi:MAG TPA: polysaccharide pyruvyl transferase family protein [Candidatus Melainabacteria bacterium]|nr:polysaccharide pyruvyl transferase family protein [Candidatus Melainabacteria bacterium]
MEISEATHLRDLPLETRLLEALAQIENFQQCALLDYPDHLNSGDHLIWLGTCFYLKENRSARITYAASIVSFDQKELKEKNGSAPIFFQGGGNLGDIWPDSQKFRESVIADNHDCPIYIMPQSIHFLDPASLESAKNIFNTHPDLTIFCRDQTSFEFAQQHFNQCRSILAPDMVFALAPVIQMFFKKPKRGKTKFLIRQDKEAEKANLAKIAQSLNIESEDWETYTWIYDGRGKLKEPAALYKKLPGSVYAVREFWQRGFAKPKRLPDRLKWRYLKRFAALLDSMPNREQTLFSWMIAFDALKQVSECVLIVTDRLHVHLAACILGVKNGLVSNSYHKNEQFFSTWKMGNKNSRFLKEDSEITEFLSESN